MADAEKQVIDRLQAGPVVRAGGIAVIPILRFTSALSTKHIATGMGVIEPVAVLAVGGDQIRAWRMDGRPASPQEWLDAMPDLARVIGGARDNRDVGPEGEG